MFTRKHMKPTINEYIKGAEYKNFNDVVLDIISISKKHSNNTQYIKIKLDIHTPENTAASKDSYISISYDNKNGSSRSLLTFI